MPRKRSTPSHLSVAREVKTVHGPADGSRVDWLPAVAAVLMTARFFLPAESADQGDTLWIVLLWLMCGVGWLWSVYRNDGRLPRPDGLTVAMALFVGGHLIGAVAVLLTEGDQRASLNMLWEWVGIGVAAMLIRQVLRTREGRTRLAAMVVISGVVLAGLGLWQHFVWYPRISSQLAELEALQAEVESADATADPTAVRSQLKRLEELRRELGWSPAIGDGAARMFRDRVQASTEPIGRFALANTLAGLLLVTLFVGLGALLGAVRPGSGWLSWGALLVGILIVAYCLWLTKSRTAMVGTLGGLVVWGLVARRELFLRKGGRWALAAVAAIGIAMPLAAVLSGSLDREVLSEAPKSLQYRIEYWKATGQLIADHWLLGVGPGNFRQYYLHYKLPESSEEILDPHNLFLDVWANGGLVGLAGLLSLLGIVVRRFWKSLSDRLWDDDPESPVGGTVALPVPRVLALGGFGTAALILAAVTELLGGTVDFSQWVVLVVGWWGATIVLSMAAPLAIADAAAFAAFVGLIIHLTGAGGIAMPAITLLLFILIFSVADPLLPESERRPDSPTEDQRPCDVLTGYWPVPAMLAGGVALVIACALTGPLPVTKARASMNIGRSLWLADRQLVAAERSFRQAAVDDPLAPDPWQELASVRFARWLQTGDEDDFRQAIAAQEESIARDPRNAGRWRSLGQLWMRRHERDGAADSADAAYAAFQEAAERYPHLAALQADLAVAAQRAGDEAQAQRAAEMALQIDALNRRDWHVDKFLSESQLAELQKIVGAEPDDPVDAAE